MFAKRRAVSRQKWQFPSYRIQPRLCSLGAAASKPPKRSADCSAFRRFGYRSSLMSVISVITELPGEKFSFGDAQKFQRLVAETGQFQQRGRGKFFQLRIRAFRDFKKLE